MKTAYVFPGQGAQFSGMGKDLYDNSPKAREMMERANDILGFRITDIMFGGSDEDLRATRVTQPAIFLHSACLALCSEGLPAPDMVGGHSLGEFSALVACGAVDFESALRLVAVRASEMQKCCEANPGGMAAIIGLPNEKVEEICAGIEGVVIPANYNCNGQVVISGEKQAVEAACEAMKAAGAKRALPLSVSGAFHSPGRTWQGHREDRGQDPFLPYLPERYSKAGDRPCTDQGQSAQAAHLSGEMDPDSGEHARGRSHMLQRVRSRDSTSGPDQAHRLFGRCRSQHRLGSPAQNHNAAYKTALGR